MQLIIDIGSEMPKYPINLTVYPDGKALMTSGAEVHEVSVKTLGEHGELIERGTLVDKVKSEWFRIHEETGYDIKGAYWNSLLEANDKAPTILEASK